MKWEEKEYERVAGETRLGDKMILACRDVLTKGKTGAEAALTHGVLPPHVSRALKVLREKRDELRAYDLEYARAVNVLEGATKYKDLSVTGGLGGVLNAAAREAAQSIKGGGWAIRESVPGQVYEGSGVVKLGGFFVQDIGRVGVIHDLKMLNIEPVLGKRLEINYSLDGKGVVKDIALEMGTRETAR